MKKLNSIKLINYVIVLFVIYFNILSYFLTNFNNFKIFFLSINVFLLIIFFLLNLLYDREDIFQKEVIKSLVSNEDDKSSKTLVKKMLFKKIKYIENKENFKLFKNIYIRNNLAKKDYNDLKSVLTKFIPKVFLDEISDKWTEKISLWISVKKNSHIMFLDIIWFTTISEKLAPERVLLLLNVYFDWILEIIKANNGYVDKFLWDGIMIIFTWDKSDSAINAALEIQSFIKKFNFSEIWKKINVWIWINSWEVIFWTIWSKGRMEITVIWDTVNIASRLESLTRILNEFIIVSENTYNSLENKNDMIINDLWYKELKWKNTKVRVYGIRKS